MIHGRCRSPCWWLFYLPLVLPGDITRASSTAVVLAGGEAAVDHRSWLSALKQGAVGPADEHGQPWAAAARRAEREPEGLPLQPAAHRPHLQ